MAVTELTTQPNRQTFARFYARFGAPCACVWILYLLALWPGILTEDSLDQWTQMNNLQLAGYHPPIHTLTNWLITRVYLSPASIAIAQVLALSLAFAAVLHACWRRGVSRLLIGLTMIVFALAPANGFMAVTLWKDVPYTIALLFLLALAMRLVENPAALANRSFQVRLVVTLASVALYRHNGLPVVVIFLMLLTFAIGAEWRRSAVKVGAAAVVVLLLVTQGLYRLMAVTPMPAFLRAQVPFHQVAAVVASDAPLAAGDVAVLTAIKPLERWRSGYRCTSVIASLAGVDAARFEAVQHLFVAVWLHLVRQAPGVVLRHERCVTGLIWNPWAPYYPVALEIVPNELGLVTKPVSPWLYRVVSTIRDRTATDPHFTARFFLWGPTLHLAVVICAAGYLFYRRRATLPLLPLATALIHTFVLLVLIPSAEFRLQYPVFVYGLLAPAVTAAFSTGDRRR